MIGRKWVRKRRKRRTVEVNTIILHGILNKDIRKQLYCNRCNVVTYFTFHLSMYIYIHVVTNSIQSHPIPSTSLHIQSHLHHYIEISGADDVDAQSNAGNGIGSNIEISIEPKN